ncbi:nucleoside 2-deoxyribosyltransferase [Sphingosinicella sp. LY1275]|uniref:nucleoside 2-deoxyribosyltransferase n=1 Tax=Sphingosinicella sp. LY1275 TaxID=3095379 RepID=UPI002ADEAD22|nr:nucleoside 2-deoxyribosyltransferase [Sphingosinicella sp. LY1275]MEA1015390.1 nucleoside 2-deoxyribosyltransferase [Sphingosinicella sp. LY1275]
MNDWSAYLAAPLFNERERRFNSELADALSSCCDVFLPQRDGLLLADLLREGVSLDVAETRIFERDRIALSRCNLLIAVLDGAHIDEGVAFEVGFAHARGALCVGLQSDVRRALPSGNNPMIGRAMSAIFTDVDSLIAFLTDDQVVSRASAQRDRAIAPVPLTSRE